VYTATITLTAKTGYTLTGVTANFFTVAGATSVSNSADSGVVTAVFPATEDESNTPVAEYLFSGDASDTSGNDNDGTVVGATLTTDRFGNTNSAYYFDGDYTDYISVANNNSLQFSDGVTLAIWAKLTTGGYLISKDASNGATNMLLHTSQYGVHPSNDFTLFNTTIADNTWHFVVATYDTNTVKIYVDGNLDNSTSDAHSFYNNTMPMSFSRKNYNLGGSHSGSVVGTLDDIRIYDVALSQSEIQTLYGEGGWTGN
jgi:hypothetical protein